MSHKIVRQNETQSLSCPSKSGKKASRRDLYPAAMLDQLWSAIERSGIPDRFHVERESGIPVHGGPDGGVKMTTVDTTNHCIKLNFQTGPKKPRIKFTLEPPDQDEKKGIPGLVKIRTVLNQLLENPSKDLRQVSETEETTIPPNATGGEVTVPEATPEPVFATAPRPSGEIDNSPSPIVGGEKSKMNWRDERLPALIVENMSKDDESYPDGWMPMSDVLVLVHEALEQCGYDFTEQLTGRHTKDLFARMVADRQIERREEGNKPPKIFYRLVRNTPAEEAMLPRASSIPMPHTISAEAVLSLKAKATRYREITASLADIQNQIAEAEGSIARFKEQLENAVTHKQNLVEAMETLSTELADEGLEDAATQWKAIVEAVNGTS